MTPLTLPSRYWADLSTRDFAALTQHPARDRVVAVLPVAATEQHGPHLPLSVDTDLVDAVVGAALPLLAPDLPVLVLPTQAVGKSNEHARFPGTLSLSADTTIRLWTDIGEGVARAGVRKLLLFNSHGGQVSIMDIVARELRCRCDLLAYSASWYSLPLPDAVMGAFSAEEHRFGIHAGDIETSMMLACRPHAVRMALAQDFRSSAQDRAERYRILGNGKTAKLGWQMQDYHPAGAAGNARAATAEKGQALIAAAGLELAALLAELSDLGMDTLRDQPDLG